MVAYVFSTLTNPQEYRLYEDTPPGSPKIVKARVMIKGGANLANNHFVTPLGVATRVTNKQLEILEQSPMFQSHKAEGHIVVRDRKADADEVAKDMKDRDMAAPYSPVHPASDDPGNTVLP